MMQFPTSKRDGIKVLTLCVGVVKLIVVSTRHRVDHQTKSSRFVAAASALESRPGRSHLSGYFIELVILDCFRKG